MLPWNPLILLHQTHPIIVRRVAQALQPLSEGTVIFATQSTIVNTLIKKPYDVTFPTDMLSLANQLNIWIFHQKQPFIHWQDTTK